MSIIAPLLSKSLKISYSYLRQKVMYLLAEFGKRTDDDAPLYDVIRALLMIFTLISQGCQVGHIFRDVFM